MDENIKDRLKTIVDYKQLNYGEFAKEISVAQSTISNIFGARGTTPSVEVILRLHQRYPDINLEWLLTGKGKMCNGSSEEVEASLQTKDSCSSLFIEETAQSPEDSSDGKNRRENPLGNAPNRPKNIVHQEIIYKERPPRRITEIRIFFDDNTYETFKPEK